MGYRFYFYAAMAFYCLGVMSMSRNAFFGIANIAVGCLLQTLSNRKRREQEQNHHDDTFCEPMR